VGGDRSAQHQAVDAVLEEPLERRGLRVGRPLPVGDEDDVPALLRHVLDTPQQGQAGGVDQIGDEQAD
jgi:hypothetical protein